MAETPAASRPSWPRRLGIGLAVTILLLTPLATFSTNAVLYPWLSEAHKATLGHVMEAVVAAAILASAACFSRCYAGRRRVVAFVLWLPVAVVGTFLYVAVLIAAKEALL